MNCGEIKVKEGGMEKRTAQSRNRECDVSRGEQAEKTTCKTTKDCTHREKNDESRRSVLSKQKRSHFCQDSLRFSKRFLTIVRVLAILRSYVFKRSFSIARATAIQSASPPRPGQRYIAIDRRRTVSVSHTVASRECRAICRKPTERRINSTRKNEFIYWL